MRISLFYRIISPFLLIIFTITSCNYFSMPQPNEITVPIGKGDVKFVFLDNDYKQTDTDVGKMAMYVENNELTSNVLVLAEIANNNIDNTVVVKIINRENDSFTSFFYNSGFNFPHKMVISMDGEEVEGRFSFYDYFNESYSVQFENEEGDIEYYKDFILNKNVFSAYEDDDELTRTQNVRMRNIITTLSLWNSLAFQIDNDFDVGARNSSRTKLVNFLKGLFIAVAIVAVVVALIIAPPAAVSVVGAVITVASPTAAVIAATVVAGAAIIGATIIDSLIPDDFNNPSHRPQSEASRPQIKVTLDGNQVVNLNHAPFQLQRKQSIEVDFSIIDLGNAVINNSEQEYKPSDTFPYDPTDIINTVDIEKLIKYFDPIDNVFIDNNILNANYFDVDAIFININRPTLRLTVTRKDVGGNWRDDGLVQFIILFKQPVIINDGQENIDFVETDQLGNNIKGKIFVLNFTSVVPSDFP